MLKFAEGLKLPSKILRKRRNPSALGIAIVLECGGVPLGATQSDLRAALAHDDYKRTTSGLSAWNPQLMCHEIFFMFYEIVETCCING